MDRCDNSKPQILEESSAIQYSAMKITKHKHTEETFPKHNYCITNKKPVNSVVTANTDQQNLQRKIKKTILLKNTFKRLLCHYHHIHHLAELYKKMCFKYRLK